MCAECVNVLHVCESMHVACVRARVDVRQRVWSPSQQGPWPGHFPALWVWDHLASQPLPASFLMSPQQGTA